MKSGAIIAEGPAGWKRRVTEAGSVTWLILRESFRSFSENRNSETAATLAYYGFLSLMPLLLLVIFLLGFFMESSEAILGGMEKLMADMFPSFNQAILQDLVSISRGRVWGLVSVVLLVWSVTPFAAAIRGAIFRIFRAEKQINYFLAKLLDLSAVLALLMLFVFMAAGKILYAAGASAAGVSLAEKLLRSAGALALTVAVIAFFYFVFSPVRLRLGALLAGSVTAAVLLGVIRPLFGLLLQYNPDYGYSFGSLKFIFLLIIWVYYTFAVILYGAEIGGAVRRKDALLLRRLFLEPGGSGRGTPQVLLDRFVRRYDRDELLFREGEGGSEMFYVLSGAVTLTKGGKVLKVMKEGDFFGEMSMLIEAARTATATASEPDTTLVAVAQENFETILRENPEIVRRILKEMALRLKSTNEQLRSA